MPECLQAQSCVCVNLQVFTSDHALKLDWIPNWIAIIGSGYIGLEFSDVYTALGSEVTFIEVMLSCCLIDLAATGFCHASNMWWSCHVPYRSLQRTRVQECSLTCSLHDLPMQGMCSQVLLQ